MYIDERNTRKGRVKIIYINKRQESCLLWVNEIIIDWMFIFILHGKRGRCLERINIGREGSIFKYEKSI